jgi:hypothetical protein
MMKLLILICVLATGTVFLMPKQKDIAGTWVLDTKERKWEVAVLRIQMAEGYFTGRLDIPEQQVYDKPVSVQIKKDSIKIGLDDRGSCFIEAAVTDSVLSGRSVICGMTKAVRFYRQKKL